MGPKLTYRSRTASQSQFGKNARAGNFKMVRKSRAQKDKKVTGGVKRGSRGSSSAVKLYNVPNSGLVFPDRVEVNLLTTMCGYIAAGNATAATGNYMSVYLNSVLAPFSTPNFSMFATTGAYSFAFHATPVQGYLASNNPMGYAALQSLYTNYRVVAYRLEVTVSPANASDCCRVVVLPLGGEEIPSTSATAVDLRVMEEQPYALSMSASAAAPMGPGVNNTLVLSGSPYKDLGLTREQYMCSGYQTSIGSVPAANIASYGGVYLQELNGSNNSVPLVVTVKLSQVVIFEDAIQQIL